MHAFRKRLVCRTPETEVFQEEQHPGSVVNVGQPKVKGPGLTGPSEPQMDLVGVDHGLALNFGTEQYTAGVVSFKVTGKSATGPNVYHDRPEGTISSPHQERGRPIYRAKLSGGTQKNVKGTWDSGSVDKRCDSPCGGMEAIGNSGSSERRYELPCSGTGATWNSGSGNKQCDIPCSSMDATWNGSSSDKRCDISCSGMGGTWNSGSSDRRRNFLCNGTDATWNSSSSDKRRDIPCSGTDATGNSSSSKRQWFRPGGITGTAAPGGTCGHEVRNRRGNIAGKERRKEGALWNPPGRDSIFQSYVLATAVDFDTHTHNLTFVDILELDSSLFPSTTYPPSTT
ncbi:hypothetical protein CERSUDRAFT_70036 [Gelatoporia subvermispora B]|uniref:Uncharacterized protein n=1 Tax=Ceriporiopsis subvermispora (strain B) TaxID=914234 RepID=M2RAQ7_CERS8|nr:hypothetical protein CERSUDRAFT_70036 [Gelatoporia subvermispora B]